MLYEGEGGLLGEGGIKRGSTDTRRSTKTKGKLYEGRENIIRRRREDYTKTIRRHKKGDTETEGRRDEDEENRGAY